MLSKRARPAMTGGTEAPAWGLLNLDKPSGVTSRDVVNQVQRLIRPQKVGHAGTLDPLAQGVLVLGLGPATRIMEYVQRQRKRYLGTFLLGRESPTEDITGEVRELPAPPRPSRDALEAACRSFQGEVLQRPPAYSALKVQGRRAYDLARAGAEVELAPRPVTFYSIQLLEYEYPKFVLEIECSGGTYVRSLGRDLAAALGTGAVMSALTRTAIGPFTLNRATQPAGLTRANLAGFLLPAALAVESLPRITLDPEQQRKCRLGQFLALDASHSGTEGISGDELAAFDEQHTLLAILARRPNDPRLWQPAKNLQ